MKEPFVFSVVTAVYNAEPFLHETVNSLVRQRFGFSRVQLILVDDGSTDGSGALCDAYRAKYPDNVFVVHQENGGVSAARNAGLPLVRGKYVSFLDADDLLDADVLKKVYAFFEAHPETDVVSVPMIFFDEKKGPHLLNRKYEAGTRVIDLTQEPNNPQLAVTSAFIRAEALTGRTFDTNLCYAEDAKLLQSILLEKRTLGVVANAFHRYRRRSQGEASAIQRSGRSPAWYHPYLRGFALDTIRLCEEKTGGVPRFIQYTIAYDLQWRIRQSHLPSLLFDEAQKAEYRQLLREIYSHIDDDVIADLTDIRPYQTGFALYLKNGFIPDEYLAAFRNPVSCEFFTVRDGMLKLECSVQKPFGARRPFPELIAEANGVVYRGVSVDRLQPTTLLDEPAVQRCGYTFHIPMPEPKTPLVIRLLYAEDGEQTPVNAITCGRFFPVSHIYRHAYARIGRRILTVQETGVLTLSKEKRGGRFFRELRYWGELFFRNRRGGRNAIVGRFVYALVKPFLRKPVWLLSDRTQAAGDNGEAMFRWLCAQKNVPAHVFFAVSDKCADFAALKKVGRVVNAKSYRHKILFLLSSLNISSQADNDIITPFSRYDEPYRDIESRIRFVFLQHGITKDDLSGWLNRFNANIAGLVTAARPEAESFRTGEYSYDDDVIWLCGFPRFDRLYHDEQRCVTIMPTWRHMWVSHSDPVTGVRMLKEGFEDGAFYRFFNALLNDRRLLDAAKRTGYTVRFLPHPLLQPHMDRFTQNPDITFLPASTPYRQVFAESDLILTDYSSVAFDFAYLRKPVVYAQADRDEFFSGEHMYTHGYFDYERDGFGEVETDYETTVDRLIEYMEHGCRLKDAYRARIDRFFAFDDTENCCRVYEKMIELMKK